MENNTCGEKATVNVIWASGSVVKMCPLHEAQVRTLCALMGWPLTITQLITKYESCESKVK